MFERIKKKSEIAKLIEADGIDHATTRFAEILSEKLTTKEVAYQFVLEEIEAASQGNEVAKKLARESGIEPSEYEGAMHNSRPEVDGAGGPQQLLLAFCFQLHSDPDLQVSFRTMIVDKLMRSFEFGKYDQSGSNEEEARHLDPNSRDYFDIRLFSLMTTAAIAAKDSVLVEIFRNATMSLGSQYPCSCRAAIDEGKAFVDKLIHIYKLNEVTSDQDDIADFARTIISEKAHNADFSGLRMMAKKRLEAGEEGVTQKGINELDNFISSHLGNYKNYPQVTQVIQNFLAFE